MIFGSVFLAQKDWLVPVLVVFAAALGFVAWSYARSSGRAGLRALCAGLRIKYADHPGR